MGEYADDAIDRMMFSEPDPFGFGRRRRRPLPDRPTREVIDEWHAAQRRAAAEAALDELDDEYSDDGRE